MKLDKRTKKYRQFHLWFNQYTRTAFVAGLIIGLIIGFSIKQPTKASPEAVETTIITQVVKEAQAVEAVTPTPKPTRKYTYQKHSNKKYYPEIISKLKVMYTNWQDAAELTSRESGFNPMVINRSSGACGLPQALPCKKMGCSLTDIDCQLKWQKDYITGRYGTVTKALKFHDLRGFY